MSVTVGAVCHVAHVVPVEFVFIQVVFISTIKSQASNSETSQHWQWMPVTCVFVALFKGYFWYSLVLSPYSSSPFSKVAWPHRRMLLPPPNTGWKASLPFGVRSEVKLTVASFLSDRIVDEILEALSSSHRKLVSARVLSEPFWCGPASCGVGSRKEWAFFSLSSLQHDGWRAWHSSCLFCCF